MFKKCLGSGLIAAVVAMSCGVSAAQGPDFGPINERPAVSPYLNLLNQGYALSGISPYQTLVQPLIEQADATNRQQAQIQQLQRQQRVTSGYGGARGVSGAVRSTGHQTRFLNLSHYYTNTSPRPPQFGR